MATKHREVFDYLERLISTEEIQNGDPLPGENDLSATLSVSRNTVRHAINELSKKYRIERTPGRGSVYLGEVSPSPNTKSIGIINSSLSYTIYPEMIHGVKEGLFNGGYSMLLANGNYDPEKEKESAKRMLANGVSGIIVEPTNSGRLNEDSEIVQVLNRSGVPVVTTNCEIPGLQASFVTVDDARIGEDAVDFLLGLGHRRIACAFKSDTQAGELRYQGYVRALERAGIPVDPELARRYTQEDEPSLPGVWFTRDILENTSRSTRPTAFVYFNDQVAHQAYSAFAELDLTVPGDVSVVGIDNIPESVRAIPSLTTFNHPKYVMGKLAAEVMLARLGKHDDRLLHGVTMRAQLVQRDSTARIA